MTPTEAIDGIVSAYFRQTQDCAEAEARYARGEITLADYVGTCFLLVYTAVKAGITSETECKSASDVVSHNIRLLAEHVEKVKAHVLELEGGLPKTANGRLVIEARWREALDWLVDEWGDSVLIDEFRGEGRLPEELESDFFA